MFVKFFINIKIKKENERNRCKAVREKKGGKF